MDNFNLAVGSCGVIFGVLTIALVYYQIKLLRKQVEHAETVFKDEQRRAKRQSTLEFVAATVQRLADLADQIPSHNDAAATVQFIEQIRSDPGLRKAFYGYFNYYEALAAGVNCGIYDIEVIYRVRGTTIIRLEELYRSFVEELRAESSHPEKFKEMQILADGLREWELASGRPSSSFASN